MRRRNSRIMTILQRRYSLKRNADDVYHRSERRQKSPFLSARGRKGTYGLLARAAVAQDPGELQGKHRYASGALVRTVSPAVTRRSRVTATRAVTAAHGKVAASSNERWLGTCTSASSFNTAHSASMPSRLAPSRSVR